MLTPFLVKARNLCVLLSLSVVGCAGLPQDWGRAEVAAATAIRGQALPVDDPQTLSQQLLEQPLTPQAAITLALIHNPSMQQTTARLGFAAAAVYDAARLANPVLSLSRLFSSDPAATSAVIGVGISFSFIDALLIPARSRYAAAEFQTVKMDVAAAVLQLAATVETSYFQLAAAEQNLVILSKQAEAAAASARLAQRYFDAGNINARALAIEKAAAAQAQIEQIRAQAEQSQARSALNRLMGLPPTHSHWTLADGLPMPVETEDRLEDLLALASQWRLELSSARNRVEAVASAHGLTRSTRLLGAVEAGFAYQKESDGTQLRGPTLALELPLFNWGQGRVARAQAELQQAEAEWSARELDVSNDVHAAYQAMQSAKSLVQGYQKQLIPQRQTVVAQAERELNYMLIGAFELIQLKQQEYEAYSGYLHAIRDYWTARAALTRAVGHALPSSAGAHPPWLTAKLLINPQARSAPQGAGHLPNHPAQPQASGEQPAAP